ncbi:uncharacterized protein LOC101833147 isoform X4 [Mesocricetus auratus]|uniref:Uncharacterized protein LOC101833147 isoform X4 n=1 Tax=Mesocricetus auratus TaxID=10036 RepID=A0ABM2XXS2_MESAU|nr:uncharacterized protein LOC101833147 isoform X4 [Mesocricetus auratus]
MPGPGSFLKLSVPPGALQVTFNTVWKKTHLIALPALESRAQGVSDVLGRTFWTVTRSHCAGLATTGDILGLRAQHSGWGSCGPQLRRRLSVFGQGEGTCEVGPHFFRQLSSGNCDPPAQTAGVLVHPPSQEDAVGLEAAASGRTGGAAMESPSSEASGSCLEGSLTDPRGL